MEKEEMMKKKLFFRFLKEYKCYEYYKNNAYNKISIKNNPMIITEIGGAFCWANTKQGWKFWNNLYEEWHIINKKINEK